MCLISCFPYHFRRGRRNQIVSNQGTTYALIQNSCDVVRSFQSGRCPTPVEHLFSRFTSSEKIDASWKRESAPSYVAFSIASARENQPTGRANGEGRLQVGERRRRGSHELIDWKRKLLTISVTRSPSQSHSHFSYIYFPRRKHHGDGRIKQSDCRFWASTRCENFRCSSDYDRRFRFFNRDPNGE